jgi:hypothetical protein
MKKNYLETIYNKKIDPDEGGDEDGGKGEEEETDET